MPMQRSLSVEQENMCKYVANSCMNKTKVEIELGKWLEPKKFNRNRSRNKT